MNGGDRASDRKFKATLATMAQIFDTLPGIPMPISEISKQLRDMWKGEEDAHAAAPSEFRASQLNLIVHFGSETQLSEAESIFASAIEFTQKHPGRIILLCPTDEPGMIDALNGKLFTQCYIGESQREMCCCEALMLEYCPDEPRSLFNQVSVWLESDLPVYHWFHRVPLKEVKNKYLSFVKNSKRVLFDSNVETDNFEEIPTPDSWRIRDLADARLLPLKQAIGQILSTFDPEAIFNGLTRIHLLSDGANQANAQQLKQWLRQCLAEAKDEKVATCGIRIEDFKSGSEALKIVFEYANDQKFEWTMTKNGKYAHTDILLGGRSARYCMTLRKTDQESILTEAIFFGQ